jgi:hypothetical protein
VERFRRSQFLSSCARSRYTKVDATPGWVPSDGSLSLGWELQGVATLHDTKEATVTQAIAHAGRYDLPTNSNRDDAFESTPKDGFYEPIDTSLLPVTRVNAANLIRAWQQLAVIAKRQAPRIAFKVNGKVLFSEFSGDKRRSTLILHKENKERRGFCLIGVATYNVYVLWALVEGLARDKRHFLATSDLHHDRPFKNVDEDMGIMTVDRVRSSWCVVDRNHQAFLARYSCQVLRQKLSYPCFLSHQCSGQKN